MITQIAHLFALPHLFACLAEDVEGRVGQTRLDGLLNPVINIDSVGGGGGQIFVVNPLHCGGQLRTGKKNDTQNEKGSRLRRYFFFTFLFCEAFSLNSCVSFQNKMFSSQCSFFRNS